ncbi:MAG: metal-dependent transcriptional regulator [Gemmatimonadetes bacterium]|nr:metal-dependent transcriptional regulator [Gemmatimonadota bacterium]
MTFSVLSRSVEDYLKAVYSLNERGKAAGTSELARALEIQPASVSGMIRRLAEDGLLEHEPYRGVHLTPQGHREALKILRRHRIIETFLVQRLGYPWDDVHDEAERLEHAASETLIDRMANALGNPATDPHGAPIPTRDGEIDPTPSRSLDEVLPGTRVLVRSVPDNNRERLRYCKSVGLVPGAQVAVTDAIADGDSVAVVVGAGTEPVWIEGTVARRVTVSESSQP